MKCDECKYCDKTERICYYTGDNRCVENQKASKHNGWIPVSERLPEYDKEVLCFLRSDEYAVCYLTNNWGNDEFEDGGFGTGAYDVVAWMPLPKPYEPRES